MSNEELIATLVDECTRVGLTKKCETRGLAMSGTKEELAARIVEYDRQNQADGVLEASVYGDVENFTDAMPATVIIGFNDVKDALNPFTGKGESVVAWILDFEDQCKVFCWSELHKFVYAKRLLEGPAKAFVRSLPNVASWKQLKSALIEEFEETTSSASIHELLRQRKKKNDESFLEYVYAMVEIGKRGKVDEVSL
uniref:Uncharacterized protein n=1 Tax=Anopheles stephensi TaxID=30069 RepID=A0A182YSY4_ANOST